MEDETFGDWLLSQIEVLKDRGLSGEALKIELRRVLWGQKRNYIGASLREARSMEEAWRICAECLERELSILELAMPDLIGRVDEQK